MKDQLKLDYRACFSTGPGKVVLTDLLMEAGFFDTDLSDNDIAVESFVKKILYKMGIYDKKDLSQQSRFVNNLFELQVELENGK